MGPHDPNQFTRTGLERTVVGLDPALAIHHILYSTPYYVGGLGFFFGTVGLGELRV